jgi:hypothetical protein
LVGGDRSLPMLKVLQRKARSTLSLQEQRRLSYCHADMRSLCFRSLFSFVLSPLPCPTYLMEPEHQVGLLQSIHACLLPGGGFVFDLFFPNRKVDALPDSRVFHDYCRTLTDGSILKRTKTIQKSIRPHINVIKRHCPLLDSSQRATQSITTRDLIRCYFPYEVEELSLRNGLEVTARFADFREGELTEATRTVCLSCWPRDRLQVRRFCDSGRALTGMQRSGTDSN